MSQSRLSLSLSPWRSRAALGRLAAVGLAVFGAGALPGELSVGAASVAQAAMNPFRVEVEAPTLPPGAKGVARVTIVVPPGHHVYRDMMWVKNGHASGIVLGEASFPPGLDKPDPANPGATRELFDMNVIIEVPVTAPAQPGEHRATIEVGYQGCKGGLCFMPATESHEVVVKVAADAAPPAQVPAPPPAPAPDTTGSTGSWKEPGSALVSTEGGAAHGSGSGVPEVDFSVLPDSASVQALDHEGKKHPVHARLLADRDVVAPGETVRLALHLKQKPGWHTYWKSPGDIGLPTDITWTVPEGATTTPYQYPVPHRYDVQSIISYGYDDQVLFHTDVTLPADLPAGELVLGAQAKWLVCEVMCIPGEAELELPLTVADQGGPTNAFGPLIDHFAAQHPTPPTEVQGFMVETALSAEAVLPEAAFEAVFYLNPAGGPALEAPVEVASWPAFTPIVQGSWMVSEVTVNATPDGGVVAKVKGETFPAEPLPEDDRVGGLFQVKVGGKMVATEVTIPLPWAAPGTELAASTSPLFALAEGKSAAAVAGDAGSAGTTAEPPQDERSFALMLLLALVGGAILNIMPCVLPVLTLKLYSVVGQQDITAAERRNAGLAYTGGVVASFLALALGVILMRTVFQLPVGWGFQFQYPEYVAALATIVFVFGLSLFGVFEVPAFGADKAATASAKEGLTGHFLTGIFTTLLATPCSAPFLGTGMGFAFSLPSGGVMLFFAVAGLGLASPFLIIAFLPGLMRFLPKPGAWMETFKQLMGFTLVATTVWLVDVFGGLVGPDGVTGFLAFLLAIGLGSWAFGRYGGPTESGQRQAGVFVVAVLVSGMAGWRFLDFAVPEAQACGDTPTQSAASLDFEEHVPWQSFTEARVEELAGTTVFIDFTADWCLTCKVNERTIIETTAVRSGMREHGVVPLKADWTRRDETITRWLQRYGRAGVPFYLVVPADRSAAPIPLGEVITPESVLEAFAEAGGPA